MELMKSNEDKVIKTAKTVKNVLGKNVVSFIKDKIVK